MKDLFYILLVCTAFVFTSCEHEDLAKPVYEDLQGGYVLDTKTVTEYVDGEKFYTDVFSDIDAELSIDLYGRYQIVEDDQKQLHFADASRYGTTVTAPNGGPSDTLGGYIQVYHDGVHMHFDLGQPEFVGQEAFLCDIDELNDSIMEITFVVDSSTAFVQGYNKGFQDGTERFILATDTYDAGAIDGKDIGYADGYVENLSIRTGYQYKVYKGLGDGFFQFGIYPPGKLVYQTGFTTEYSGADAYDAGEALAQSETTSINRTYTFTYRFKKK